MSFVESIFFLIRKHEIPREILLNFIDSKYSNPQRPVRIFRKNAFANPVERCGVVTI